MNKLEYLDKKLEKLSADNVYEDDKTRKWKWKKPSKMKSLEKKSNKKADHVLVEYLTQKYTVRRMLCRVVAGNIIVVDNKVHMLNPKDVWRDGKNVWYKIREIDRLPISNRDYDKLIKQKRITVNDAVIIKAIVGAIQKKEIGKEAKKWIIWIVVLGVLGFLAYVFFFAK
jgi:hypothetical protein